MSKEEYETCRITNPSPRLIAICDKPYEDKYYTITFRPFTPQPGGLEFLPGHDYYFISTSSKEDLHRRIGGRCTSDNMKVVFKVCCSNDTSSSSATSRNNCEYCMGIREKKMKKKPNFQRMSLRGCFQSYNYYIKKNREKKLLALSISKGPVPFNFILEMFFALDALRSRRSFTHISVSTRRRMKKGKEKRRTAP